MPQTLISSFETLIDLLSRAEFIGGLIAGTVALVFIVIVGMGNGGTGWGIALVSAVTAAVFATFGQRLGLSAGLAALVVGGWLLERNEGEEESGNWTPVAWLALIGGAVTVSIRGGLPGDLWIQFLVPIFILTFGFWLRAWRHLRAHVLLGPLFAITAFGVWTTVPETETARILVGASVPLALATLPRVDLRISSGGAFAVAGTLGWIAAGGGATRPGSIIGSLATCGVLLLLPLLADRAPTMSGWTITLVHFAIVLVSARVIGLWQQALNAAIGVTVLYVTVYAAVVLTHQNSVGDDVEFPAL